MSRFQHTYQLEAINRITTARTLLAEAGGLLRACAREAKDFTQLDGLSPEQQANEVEKAESQLGLVVLLISKAPAGSEVG